MAALAVVLMLAATACSDHMPPPPYEVAVAGWDPVYCYRTLADPDCTATPMAGEAGRLVNYYGPPPTAPRLDAPPPIDTFVRDPEPVPQPSSPRPVTR